jgi:hypothetical protein
LGVGGWGKRESKAFGNSPTAPTPAEPDNPIIVDVAELTVERTKFLTANDLSWHLYSLKDHNLSWLATSETIMKSPSSPRTQAPAITPFAQARRWFQQVNSETRTRILLLYVVTMLGVFGVSIPVFLYFLSAEVNDRVRDNLAEEVETFETAYARWDAATDNTVPGIRAFVDEFLATNRPEDDNFGYQLKPKQADFARDWAEVTEMTVVA